MKPEFYLKKLAFLFIVILISSCGGSEDEEDDTTNDGELEEKQASEGISISADMISENIPVTVFEDEDYGELIKDQIDGLTDFVGTQSDNLKPDDAAIKTVDMFSAGSAGCLNGNESFNERYTWSYEGLGYTLSFGEDTDNYYWATDWTSSFDGSSDDFVYKTNAYEAKTGFEGCVYYEINGTGFAKIQWETTSDNAQVLTYEILGENEENSFSIVLQINADGSGSLDYISLIYSWDAEGNVTISTP